MDIEQGKLRTEQNRMNRAAAWWLMRAPGWGAVKLRQLTAAWGMPLRIQEILKESGSVKVLYEMLQKSWQNAELFYADERLRIFSGDLERLIAHVCEKERCAEEYYSWISHGFRFVTSADKEYPDRLRPLYDRPFALYGKGNLPDDNRKSAAVIGARACSGYGAFQAKRIARELAAQGVQIISGLAYGVDSEGHWGALESGVKGATYAVLGSGVDQCYPREHEKLAEQIVKNGGGIISEFPPGTTPAAGNFPMRNRIISGLSDCILVMEARQRSGSLITVDQALEQGKEVFALPGHVGDRLSEGCHQLIRNGAAILTSGSDVLDFLYPGEEGKISTASDAQKAAYSEKNAVYSCLDCSDKSLEEILDAVGLPINQVRAQLLDLLMEGQIIETSKGYYRVR